MFFIARIHLLTSHTYYVTRGSIYALVHGIINTLVGSGDDTDPFIGILAANGQGVVLRAPILDDDFPVLMGLVQDTLYGVANRDRTIVGGGDNGDFHSTGMIF